MKKPRLDPVLIAKIAKKNNKHDQYIYGQIAKRANRLGISSEAVLALWVKEEGFGTALYRRKLAPEIQAQIRGALTAQFSPRSDKHSGGTSTKARSPKKLKETAVVEWMIGDEQLLDRCKDLLKATRNFDRVFREATTVLEDRIKKLSGVKNMKTAALVSKVLNPDPNKAILVVSQEAFEQEGFFSICKGLMLAFRDTTHHELSNKFNKEDALKFCGFIDSVLTILGNAKKQTVA